VRYFEVVGLWIEFMMFTDILVFSSSWLSGHLYGYQCSVAVGLLGGLLDRVHDDCHLLAVEAHIVWRGTV
jgi:hypothetical protein